MEFNKRNFNNGNDKGYNRDNNRNDDRGFNRDNRDNGGFRDRNYGNRENRDGDAFRERFRRDDNQQGGGFRERSFGGDRDNNRGGGGFRKEFRRDDRPPRPVHELVHTAKFRAGKRRTYFFDVRKTENGDHYLTVTESTQKINGGYDRHKVFLYKEDFNRFVRELSGVVDLIKTDLQPDYDYDEFERRQLEWEEQRRLEAENGEGEDLPSDEVAEDRLDDVQDSQDEIDEPIAPAKPKSVLGEEDEDMSW